jgi:hypothetical protein
MRRVPGGPSGSPRPRRTRRPTFWAGIRRAALSGRATIGLAACGGGGSAQLPTATPAAATACLRAAGRPVVSGSPNPKTAAIAQLLTSGAYIAFYSSSALAAKAEPAIARTARALRGSTVQEGSATVDFAGSPLTAAGRKRILACVS